MLPLQDRITVNIAAIERRPVVDVGWCLAGVARPPADLAWHLERGEPSGPRGEQRVATELVQLGEDRDERVVGGVRRFGEPIDVRPTLPERHPAAPSTGSC